MTSTSPVMTTRSIVESLRPVEVFGLGGAVGWLVIVEPRT